MSFSEPNITTDSWVPEDTFGLRLAVVRQRMRWNVLEAANACGIGSVNWRKWEHGTKPRDIHDAARKIADRTGCDYTWLMVGGTLRRNDARPTLTVHEGGRATASAQLQLPFLWSVR